MLEIKNLDVHYGVIHSIKNVSLEVKQGEIVTLIGANGAGKTTILRTISGLKKPTGGTVTFEGTDITNLSAQDRVRLGISHVPEGRRVFYSMTVLENLQLGAYLRRDKAGINRDLELVYRHFPILADRKRQLAGTLSGGEQQMLAMGRALMAIPRCFFLMNHQWGLHRCLFRKYLI